jgi:GNAT superfamily N-acetyltransferase
MNDTGKDAAGRAATGHRNKEQAVNDTQVYIRIATPSDSEKLRGMFTRTSKETIHKRFHIPYPELPEWMVGLMLDSDHHDKEALVAVAEEKIIGHAMYVRLEDDTEAEMAILVEDGWQSKGVGKSLLSELAQRAKLRSIETFTGDVLGTNRRMLGLATMFIGTNYKTEDSVYHVRMPLRTLEPAAQPALTLPRAA